LLAILIETGSNEFSQVVQQRRPHDPYPPSILASSRAPIAHFDAR
jgi:hypothetical protein